MVNNSGFLCAIKTIDGNLYFCRIYCSDSCLQKYINEPHIFGNKYVEHFYSDIPLKPPQPHMYDAYTKFIETHKEKFLGPCLVSTEIEKHNNALNSIGLFLLRKNK
jgi:hypothetical protein